MKIEIEGRIFEGETPVEVVKAMQAESMALADVPLAEYLANMERALGVPKDPEDRSIEKRAESVLVFAIQIGEAREVK